MNDIEKILHDEFGVGPVIAPNVAVLWAAEMIKDKSKAKSELQRINRLRAKYGAALVYAPYGHHAF